MWVAHSCKSQHPGGLDSRIAKNKNKQTNSKNKHEKGDITTNTIAIQIIRDYLEKQFISKKSVNYTLNENQLKLQYSLFLFEVFIPLSL